MKWTFLTGLQIPSLVASLKEGLLKIEKGALIDTEIACEQNMRNSQSILNGVTSEIKILKDRVMEVIEPEVGKLTRKISHADPEGLYQTTAYQAGVLQKKMNNLSVDAKRIPISYSWKEHLKMNIIIYAISIVDAFLNYKSFSLISGTILGGIVLSLLIALIIAGAINAIALRIRNANLIAVKYIWFFSALLGASGIFYGFGLIRQNYAEAMNTSQVSPFWWMFICVFIYAIGLILSISKAPTQQERLDKENLERKKSEIGKLEAQKRSLFNSLGNQEKKYFKLIERRELFIQYRDRLLLSLDNQTLRIHALIIKEFALKNPNDDNHHTTLLPTQNDSK